MKTLEIIKTQVSAETPLGKDYAVKVESRVWKQYLALKAEQAAIAKQVKAIESALDFPEASELAESFSCKPGDGFSVSIVNGNQDILGKLSVFWYPGASIPSGWRKRIS